MGCTISIIPGKNLELSAEVLIKDDDVLEECKDSLPLMERGVRLGVAKDIVAKLNKVHERIARDVLKRKPSHGEVIVHGLVKKIAEGESYAEFLKRSSDSSVLVGKVNVFVSHA